MIGLIRYRITSNVTISTAEMISVIFGLIASNTATRNTNTISSEVICSNVRIKA